MTSHTQAIREFAQRALGDRIRSIRRMPGGYNSTIYTILAHSGNEYIAKHYTGREGDGDVRLETEYSAFSFLRRHGIRSVPEPVALSRKHRLGMYEFLAGKNFLPGQITRADVSSACDFLKTLHGLVNAQDADTQPVAKEACFTLKEYITVEESRLFALQSLPKVDDTHVLHQFLESEFVPVFTKVTQFVERECRRLHIAMDSTLPKQKRTLSPSDFGFHNAVKLHSTIYFYDFEYFGWDDPAKMIADFYLHPAMALPSRYRAYFFQRVHAFLGRDDDLPKRLALVYALLALKWCLIMLNIFRRAETLNGKNTRLAARQLAKAKAHLYATIGEFEKRSFPLSLIEQP